MDDSGGLLFLLLVALIVGLFVTGEFLNQRLVELGLLKK